MLVYVEQDIFQSPAQVIVNAVNTVGIMGKGIAKRFKEIYPDMYKLYRQHCEDGLLDVGKLSLHRDEKKWVLNFPTKKHWRNPSKIEYIESGLRKFVETYREKGITSISFPQLGCGNGGLDWESEVKPLMEKYLKGLPIDVFIHLYSTGNTQVEHLNKSETLEWLRKDARNLSFVQIWDDLTELVKVNSQNLIENESWEINFFESNKDNLDDDSHIQFESDELVFKVDYNTFLDLWIKLRDYGYITRYDLPRELSGHSGILLSLLEKLPYLQSIQLMSPNGNGIVGITINNTMLPDVEKYVLREGMRLI